MKISYYILSKMKNREQNDKNHGAVVYTDWPWVVKKIGVVKGG